MTGWQVARTLGIGRWFHLKMLSRSAFDGILGILWPLFFATVAFLMYRINSDDRVLLYASVGASVMGVWSSVSTSGSGRFHSRSSDNDSRFTRTSLYS